MDAGAGALLLKGSRALNLGYVGKTESHESEQLPPQFGEIDEIMLIAVM
jgi:hypothetical protein